MTTTRDDLLRAVLASPDDAERLVYADWLEQHGDPAHAQVIHLQCELARLGREDPHGRRRVEVALELGAALAELGTRWRDELPVLDGVEWLALERGFAGTVRVRDVAALVEHAHVLGAVAPVTTVELEGLPIGTGDGFAEAVPWLRTLRVSSPGAQAKASLLSVPRELELVENAYDDLDWIERDGRAPLERLSVIGNQSVGRTFAERLAGARWAESLEVLELGSRWQDDNTGYSEDPRLGAEGTDALAELTALRVLNVDRQRTGATALGRLVGKLPALRELSARENGVAKLDWLKKSRGLPLVRLDLGRNALGNAGAKALATSPRTASLQRLELDTCELASVGLVELARAPLWQTLRYLDLSRNPLGTSGARALGEATRPAHLHTLLLADADLDEAAGHALGKVRWLGELAVLDLSGNMLGRGAGALRNLAPEALRVLRLASIGLERAEAAALARFWPHLVELDLGGNALTDFGLERFATTKEAAALQRLVLRDCQLGDDGLELLARARTPRLRVLDLAGNRLGGAALAALLQAPCLRRVEHLDLSRCTLADDVIATLARTALPPRLRRLQLRGIELDPRALLALADAPPLRSLARLALDANPWTLEPAVRDRLEARFGPGWYQYDPDEAAGL